MGLHSRNESLAGDGRIGRLSPPLPLGAYRIFRGGQKAARRRKKDKRRGVLIEAFAEVT